MAFFTNAAQADDFAVRCAELPRQAQIAVVFRDRPVATDAQHNVLALNRLAGAPAGENHNVYGLTYAKPDFRLQVAPRTEMAGDGRVCAVPDIAIELGFSEFVVYLASELTDPCHQDIIRQHEQEHVNTWRSHLRASAQMLATVLRNNLGEPLQFTSGEDAEAAIRNRANELVAPWIKRILSTVSAAQAAIDTPVSYGIVTSRLRTCGQAVRGGSR